MPGPTNILVVDLAIAPQTTQALSQSRSCAIQTEWKPIFSLSDASSQTWPGAPLALVNETSKSIRWETDVLYLTVGESQHGNGSAHRVHCAYAWISSARWAIGASRIEQV